MMNEENKVGQDPAQEPVKTTAESAPVVIEDDDDSVKVMSREEFEQAKLRQRLPVGIIAGIIVGILCAGIWAAIAVYTETIHSFMAILVGLAVGFAIRFTGRGVEPKFGVAGAVIALLSCALGNFLATIGFLAGSYNVEFFDLLFNFDWSQLPMIMKETFEPIDLLFYGLAVVAGFTASYHSVKVE